VQIHWINSPHWVEIHTRTNLGNNIMTTLNPSTLTARLKKPSPRLLAYGFYIAGVVAAVMAAAVLISAQA
jgi:hypothetical protein